MRPGTRLRSQVSSTEVIVVSAPSDELDLRCGGYPMIDIAATPQVEAGAEPEDDATVLLGKRYASSQHALEILVTKGGVGALSVDGTPLEIKPTKALPTSD
jgi:hypothetical protein